MNLYEKKHGDTSTCFVKSQRKRHFLQLLTQKALLMRVSIIALLLSVSGLLLAGDGRGQDLDKILVSVQLKNATLKNALRKIEAQTSLSFAYKTNDIAPYSDITYQAKNISLSRLLSDILGSTDLGYEQVNSSIVIKKAKRTPTNQSGGEMTVSGKAFDGGLRGRINDEKGDPIPNASVQVVGTKKGTIANSQGEFVITGIPAGTYKLLVSAIGYEDDIREITIRDNDELDLSFQMKEKSGSMSEVVVTALGISRKERSLGYSTQEIKGQNLTLTREQNVLGSLAGKIAGVQVTGSSGASMGGTQKIKIRGVNSIAGNDQPLIVVDGTPISNANFAGNDKADFGNLGQDINPEDIESVNVLKGPAASALYGIRGQYGVIMITTKKGKKGPKKVTVDFNSSYSIDRASNFFPLQNLYGGGSSQTWSTLANG